MNESRKNMTAVSIITLDIHVSVTSWDRWKKLKVLIDSCSLDHITNECNVLAKMDCKNEIPKKSNITLTNKFFLVAPILIENGTLSLTAINPKILQNIYNATDLAKYKSLLSKFNSR